MLLASSMSSTAVLARNDHSKSGPWKLPSASSRSSSSMFAPPQPYSRHAFLDECENLASILARLARGGGADSSGPSDPNDEYSSYYGNERYSGSSYNSNNNNSGKRGSYDKYSSRGPASQQRSEFQPNYNNDREDDEDPYYDYMDSNKHAGSSSQLPSFLSSMPSVIRNGDRGIGLTLLGSGAMFTMLGVSLFFNKSLMRLGNLLFIAGVPMTIGPSRTAGYFLQPTKTRATACLAAGILLVFLGMPVFGMALEILGILNLFGNMFPVLLAVAKQMPVIGPILSGSSNSRNDSNNARSRNNNRRQDDYYDDDGRGWDPEGDRDYDRRDE